jgi:hypothetical protein
MRPHYDLKEGKPNYYAKRIGSRGRKVMRAAFEEATNTRVLDEDVAELFPTSKAVNDALRELAKISKRMAKPGKRRNAAA